MGPYCLNDHDAFLLNKNNFKITLIQSSDSKSKYTYTSLYWIVPKGNINV